MRPEPAQPPRLGLMAWLTWPRGRRLAFVLALTPGVIAVGLLAPALRAPGLLLGGAVWIGVVWTVRDRIERTVAARTSAPTSQEPKT